MTVNFCRRVNYYRGRVTSNYASDMTCMFYVATAFFDGDITKWDVPSATYMKFASSVFNGDISKWDVSVVIYMDSMFHSVRSFNQQLCGSAWVNSHATKAGMFVGSSGSIDQTACEGSSPQRWLTHWQEGFASITTSAVTLGSPACDTFKKSGQVSCCAPGGAWCKQCGGARSTHAVYSWLEGAETCARKSRLMSVDQCLCPRSACMLPSFIFKRPANVS